MVGFTMADFISRILFIPFCLFYETSIIYAYIYGYIKYIKHTFDNKVNSYWIWAETCVNFAGCKFVLIKDSAPLYIDKKKRCVFLLNHRDMFDFPIDCYLTGGSGMFIARYINMFVFPLQCIYTYITNTVYYFKRDAVYDKQLFNKNVYNNLLKSNCININIYPEGTRIQSDNIVPIKKGAIHLSWKYKMCSQIIITRNKEMIFNIKNFIFNYGVKLYCFRSEPIDPNNFESFDEFSDYVKNIWEKSWNTVYGKKESELIVEPLIVTPFLYPLKAFDYFMNNLINLFILGYILYIIIF